jgi:hypothetical protein
MFLQSGCECASGERRLLSAGSCCTNRYHCCVPCVTPILPILNGVLHRRSWRPAFRLLSLPRRCARDPQPADFDYVADVAATLDQLAARQSEDPAVDEEGAGVAIPVDA